MTRIFISYAHGDDDPFVRALHASLKSAGLQAWWDVESMPSRALTFHHEIRVAIDACDRLLLVTSPAALASDYVHSEWQYALSRGIAITPVLRDLDPAQLPEELRDFHAVRASPGHADAPIHAETIRLLREAIPPLAPAIGVPAPPPHFLPRAELERTIAERLFPNLLPPAEAASAPRALVLFGMSGSGKSTIAAAFARSIRTRRAFSGAAIASDEAGLASATIWLSCGPDFQPGPAADHVLRRLELPLGPPHEALERLKAALSRRTVLLVLDDVRAAEPVQPLLDACGPGCRLLLTTLNGAIATDLGALEVRVDVLARTESLSLLRDWTGAVLPAEAGAIAQECGDLPFALAVSGAMLADGQPGSTILALFRQRDLESLRRKFPTYPHPHLFRALDVAVALLGEDEPEAARRYRDLSVFREGGAIPEAAIVRFWGRDGSLGAARASALIAPLERRSLLRVKPTRSGRMITLHSLHLDYIRRVNPDSPQLHCELVDAYRPPDVAPEADRWARGPDDGYYFQNLAYHLAAAHRTDDLQYLISRDWMQARLAYSGSASASAQDMGRSGISGFTDDVDIAWQAEIGGATVDLCKLARLHAARLVVHDSASAYDDAYLEALVALGRPIEAIALAKAQFEAESRFDKLFKAHGWIAQSGRVDEDDRPRLLAAIARELEHAVARIEDEQARVLGFARVGLLLEKTDPETAARYLNDAESSAARLQDGRLRVYCDLAALLGPSGDPRVHLFVVHAIEAAGTDRTLLQLLAKGLAHPALGDEIAGFVARVRTLEDADTRDYVTTWACHSLVELRRFDDAEATLATIAAAGHRAQGACGFAWGSGTEDPARVGRVLHAAAGVALASRNPMEAAVALAEIAAELGKLNDPDADALFDAAERAARHPDTHPSNQLHSLSRIAVSLIDAGRLKRGLAMARAIGDTNLRLQMDPMLVSSLARAGRYDEAQRLARRIPKQHTKDSALATICVSLLERREFVRAERTIASMGDVLGTKLETLGRLVRALVAAGQADRAIALARAAPAGAAQADMASFLATALAQSADPRATELLQLATEATHAAQRKRSGRELDEGAAEIAKALVDLRQLGAAEAVARCIGDDPAKALALVSVAAASRQRAPRRAALLFNEAQELTRNAPISAHRRQFLSDISAGEGRNLMDRGIERIGDQRLETLAMRLLDVQEFERARTLAKALLDDDRKARVRQAASAARRAPAAQREPRLDRGAALAGATTPTPDATQLATQIATTHAMAGRFEQAFATLALRDTGSPGERERPLPEYVRLIAAWAPRIELAQPGLALRMLQEVTEVACWLSADWQAIHRALATVKLARR